MEAARPQVQFGPGKDEEEPGRGGGLSRGLWGATCHLPPHFCGIVGATGGKPNREVFPSLKMLLLLGI